MRLLILGSPLPNENEPCGLVQYEKDLDSFRTGEMGRYSASAEMAITILVMLTKTVLGKYADVRSPSKNTKIRLRLLEKALAALEAADTPDQVIDARNQKEQEES